MRFVEMSRVAEQVKDHPSIHRRQQHKSYTILRRAEQTQSQTAYGVVELAPPPKKFEVKARWYLLEVSGSIASHFKGGIKIWKLRHC